MFKAYEMLIQIGAWLNTTQMLHINVITLAKYFTSYNFYQETNSSQKLAVIVFADFSLTSGIFFS